MKRLRLGAITVLVVLLSAPQAWAAQSSSSHYQVNEVQFGPGGLLNASSPHYQAQENLGSTGVGSASSPNYGANAGFLTPNEPFLEMVVNGTNLDLGTLSSVSASTGTATFHVRAYVDSGYTVISMNQPPTNEEGVALHNMSTVAASSPGTEEFGMNLVANTTACSAPANFGANPVPVPNSTYAHGQAASGYNTCGLFKYNAGDIVAQSGSYGWGETDYTISYLVNINSISKAGRYNMTQDLVAVATY
jgi:hypothetical protein